MAEDDVKKDDGVRMVEYRPGSINPWWKLYYKPASERQTTVLGANLKQLRLEQGLSRRELCEMTGIGKDSIQKIEDYGREPRISMLDVWLTALGYQMTIGKVRKNQKKENYMERRERL